MPDFPVVTSEPPLSILSTFDARICAIADFMLPFRFAANSTSAWPSISLAWLVPIQVPAPITITKMAVYNGATVSGNVDVGVYDTNLARLVSIGGVAQAGISQPQVFDVTDTPLLPGDYFLAQAVDNTTGLYFKSANPATTISRALRCLQMATAYPLPATITPANPSSSNLPFISALAAGAIL